jgi:hypothetical protein
MNAMKKYLRNLPVVCVICGCMILVPSAWSGELEDLKKRINESEKIQEGTQTKDAAQATLPDKIEIGYKNGLYIKTKDGKYSLRLHFLLQPQYQYLAADRANNINTFTSRHGQMRTIFCLL